MLALSLGRSVREGGKLTRFQGVPLWAPRALSLISLALSPQVAHADSNFVPTTIREAIGVERGSTALIGPVEKNTYFITFDTFGSEDIGPSILSTAAALPDLFVQGDQFDAVAVLGGPFETGRQELLAGGLGYRIKLPNSGPTLFVNGDYADIRLGAPANRAIDATGQNWTITVGARQDWVVSRGSKLTGELSFTARQWKGQAFDRPVLDEDLRVLSARFSYAGRTPLGIRQRFGVILHKGRTGLGSSDTHNPMASLPGASSDFLTVSFSADLAVPLTEQVVATIGAIGQYSDAPLPFSQRCGYGTNEFSRAFDRAFVNGDECLGGRGEMAYNLPAADLSGGLLKFLQLFAAADAGWLWNIRSDVAPASQDTWASAYLGVRAATSNFIAEASLSRTVDEPDGIVEQKGTRLWVRSAMRF